MANIGSFRERVGALRNLRPFVAMVWRTSPGLALASVALRLVRALAPVATLYVGKLIIDEVVRLAGAPAKPETFQQWLEGGLLTRLGLLLLTEFALTVMADVLGRVVSLVDSLLSERVTNASSVRLMEHAATLDLEVFEDAEFQDQLERARRQSSGRMTLMSQLLGQAQNMVTVASFAAGLVIYAPWLIALLVLALAPAFLGEAHFSAKSYSLDFGRTPERRELDYIRQTAASVDTAKEVKIFGLNAFLIDRYMRLATDFYAANRKLAVKRAWWGGLFTAIGASGYYIAYAYIVWRTLTGAFSVGDLTFLAGSFRRLHGLLEDLLSSFSSIAGQALYLDDLFSFFDVRPKIMSPPNPLPFPKPIREGFVFEDVGFIYPGAERWAVRHLSFTLRAGEVVALVGENGAGKTTLVKLLARLYDPSEGRILLDGHDLREYDLDALRGGMGVIFQDFVRYNFSAGDNIAVGRIEARDDRARVERAAMRGRADGVIAKLPGGYDQMIGKRFKNGVELSGGEWQKIAIARAYMREADVLILDEPTAALDARSEFEVFQRFKELSKGKTAVLISHRFSSVRMADRILVLADGAVEGDVTLCIPIAKCGRKVPVSAPLSIRPDFEPGRLWSLLDMMQFYARPFLEANRLVNQLVTVGQSEGAHQTGINSNVRSHIDNEIVKLITQLNDLEFNLTRRSAERLRGQWGQAQTAAQILESAKDVQSRFLDEAETFIFFRLPVKESQMFADLSPFGSDVSEKFPILIDEIREAAKCLALDRSTASAFHSIRSLESAIRAIARCLRIPDPTRAQDRSWGNILKSIKTEYEIRWPTTSDRMSGDGRFFEEAHGLLTAIQNPYRNATMHLDQKYTVEEARHMFEVVGGFMRKLSSRMDEDGIPLA